jgi:hypothetical protein
MMIISFLLEALYHVGMALIGITTIGAIFIIALGLYAISKKLWTY